MELKDLLAGQSMSFLNDYVWLFIPLMVWVLVWKGMALWKAARKESSIWFVLLLILNTLGILEIIYYFFIDNKKEK